MICMGGFPAVLSMAFVRAFTHMTAVWWWSDHGGGAHPDHGHLEDVQGAARAQADGGAGHSLFFFLFFFSYGEVAAFCWLYGREQSFVSEGGWACEWASSSCPTPC